MIKPKEFDKHLQHSIELLQKAEKLALKYDAENGYYLAFSGGKDSQALYHVAKLAGVKFQAHMNFTSVDPPQVIRFVRKQYPDVITHAPSKSIYQLAIERGILPSMRIRWCCADLKESAGAGKVTLIGIRKQESVRRSKRHEVEVSNRRFSGDMEQFAEWQQEEIKKREEKLLRKMKREGKKVNEDFFSADKENEVRCINGQDSILVSPIFEWTEQDVWYFLNEVVKVPHCELYDQGYKRIGCILCPMSQYRQKVRELKEFPHVKRGWIRAIKEIRRGGVFLDGYIWWNIRADWRFDPTDNRRLKHWNLPPPQRQREMAAADTNLQRKPSILQNKQHHPLRGNFSTKTTIGRSQSSSSGTASAPSFTRGQFGSSKPLEPKRKRRDMVRAILNSPLVSGNTEGQDNEDVIAEAIFDWWISGKSYSKWYADKFLQQKLNFSSDEEPH